MVVLPVFLQAPWVRLHPFSAVLFTVVLLAIGIPLRQGREGRDADIGSLLVGFSGSWLAGCLFWGWLRSHPVLHLPIEAFALPLAITGLNSRWHLHPALSRLPARHRMHGSDDGDHRSDALLACRCLSPLDLAPACCTTPACS